MTALRLRDRLAQFKAERILLVDDLKRLTAAYLASGGAAHLGSHYKVIDVLARAGLFRTRAVLVGPHAFVSIGAALGLTWSAATIATADNTGRWTCDGDPSLALVRRRPSIGIQPAQAGGQ